ncbi:MAG TPA: response regulator transcription factor [Firmicutes bacterium]|nr:response regulator transcription factor [Bacillota bacterium]
MLEKILVVDDEEYILELLRYHLEREYYKVVLARNGNEALAVAKRERPDLIILDIMLPGVNGFEVCRILRETSNVPILMLTAKREEADRVMGLELGADDYVTKPFSLRELLARVRAILRRTRGFEDQESEEVIQRGEITIYPLRHEVFIGNTMVDLTATEFELLTFLAQFPGRAFTREELLQRLWGYEVIGDSRTVDVHIRHLREKIEVDAANPNYIKTVRGVGYKFEDVTK